ncbi:alpha-glucan family phosphorylase [Ammoniphilus sp. CFH 90114]|uniref:alpha-glucan family phosphorylase n=1 Tax=Ammoniphilus sp. CFH 90114 TaxID=2493665 RepID=UPI00101005F0|nr:alpha-glucan family phosphorylase [Ammoniphilus sp. CFH 90114]RXT08781.1 alpha-glucan family phosphorylase [Ammoniphilus sp. CFH 90114]
MEAKIAYFSAEFGIDASLPIYSGGLGVLAGDHVKAANDLGVPLIAVGILYRRGYFQQSLDEAGNQQVYYPEHQPEDLPILPILDDNGQPKWITVPIEGRTVYLRIWRAEVGDVPVYLLDAHHEKNTKEDQSLTNHLYGGNTDTRIAQEIILGIGGVRCLRAVGEEPEVWHMNEGHSAFMSLERIREYSAQGISFETALEAVRASTVFTTHTPVPAGHDHFSFEQMDRYLGQYYWQLGASRETVLELGRIEDRFNMTRLAVSTACKVNGVSKLHAEVTKELFHQWTPDIPKEHIQVTSITNGIHTKTWVSKEMEKLYNRYLQPEWKTRIAERKIWEKVKMVSNEELWSAHQQAKQEMIQALRLPDLASTLTVGFARRFATYKRALLLFRDLERLEQLVGQLERPIAFLFAGKAHPADLPGQKLIRQIWQLSQEDRFKDKIFLLENYDMTKAKYLISGVDVWLNTPIKPMEASGTSGQKAAVNGVLNCSILDGWWAEGYNGKNGWAIESGTHHSPEEQDQADSEELYRLLEEEIVPMYYQEHTTWVDRMKESIQTLTPVFSTSCMLAEYWGKLYIPTAIRGRRFAENGLEVAKRVSSYKKFIRENWHQVHIQKAELVATYPKVFTAHCKVRLGPIWHKDVRIEAVGHHEQEGLWRKELQLVKELDQGYYLYAGSFPGTLEDWNKAMANVRVLPISPDFSHDFELELVRWG